MSLSPRAPRTTLEVLGISPVVPVVVIQDAAHAVPLARALHRGGIGVVEVTLRTLAGLESIARIAREVPGICVGAGTVVTGAQAASAQRAGAQFVVTPGSPPSLVDAVLSLGLPLLTGAGTLTEMMVLLERGQRALKFFPAEQSGGTAYLQAVAGPLPDLVLCPTGGITAQSAPGYLALPTVACVGGSWLTPPALLAVADWDRVEQLADQAHRLQS